MASLDEKPLLENSEETFPSFVEMISENKIMAGGMGLIIIAAILMLLWAICMSMDWIPSEHPLYFKPDGIGLTYGGWNGNIM